MRHSAVLAAVYAVGALASPVVLKRAYVTEVTWVTVTKYVTPGHIEPTPIPEPVHQDESHQEPPKDEPEEQVPAPVITPEPTPEPIPEPTSEQPVEEAPVEEAPVEETPVEEAPVEEAPVEDTPTETEQPADPAPEQPAETPAPEQPAESPAPEQPSTPEQPSGSSYEEVILYHHNVHRANHSAADLTWSADLTAKAFTLANSCDWGHNMDIGGGGYGQNLAGSAPEANITASISEGWYNNEAPLFQQFYGMEDGWTGEQFHEFGHFTQMVWKDTKEVGCATVDCRSKFGMHYTVCNYGPPGNVAGSYDINVARPNGNPTVRWNALL